MSEDQNPTSPAEPQAFRHASIFVVDDDDIDVTSIRRSLKKLRLLNPIVRARDGQEALDMLRDGRVQAPYIILLDLNMPRLGGLEFLRILREDPVLTNAIVFVLTTSQADEDITAAYRDHVAGYMLKQRVGEDFLNLIGLIEHYWRLVELPGDSSS
ncbi:response regulator [Martelella limonii]|uniref:response regulator n=1 Tax=Martelella limonii TaxID=1647649 RepID=UPI00158080F9|nr:response regulator [Martelella limonii]